MMVMVMVLTLMTLSFHCNHVTPTLSCSLRLARGHWPEPKKKDRHIAVTLAVPHYTPRPSL